MSGNRPNPSNLVSFSIEASLTKLLAGANFNLILWESYSECSLLALGAIIKRSCCCCSCCAMLRLQHNNPTWNEPARPQEQHRMKSCFFVISPLFPSPHLSICTSFFWGSFLPSMKNTMSQMAQNRITQHTRTHLG